MNGVPISMKAVAIALATLTAIQLSAQDLAVPGFTKESFALLKQRAEAGDAKAQELYKKVVEANRELLGAVDEAATEKAALDTAKAEIQESEASTGVVTADMFTDADKAFVVNGFFIGMSIDDAMARLVRVLPTKKARQRPRSSALAESVEKRGLEGLWIGEDDELFCLAVNGRVVRLLIPADFVGSWLKLASPLHEGRVVELWRRWKLPRWDWWSGVDIIEHTGKTITKSIAGAGSVTRLDQNIYHLGLVKECDVTYFGESKATSDAGVSIEVLAKPRSAFADGVKFF